MLCFVSGGLDLAIEGPSKAEINCVDNKDGTCTVSYMPMLPGDYNILVRYNDKHIAGSPFTARITGTLLKKKVIYSKKGKCGCQNLIVKQYSRNILHSTDLT